MRKIFSKAFYGFAGSRRLSIFSEVALTGLSLYFILKKTFSFSLTGYLANNYFRQPLIDAFVVATVLLILLAVVFKIIKMVEQYYPQKSHSYVEANDIASCLARINEEVVEHISVCNNKDNVDVNKVVSQHTLKKNVALVVDQMISHIISSFKDFNLKARDVFITLYVFSEDNKSLDYYLHCPSRKDWVETRKIILNSRKFKYYESVKLLKSDRKNSYVLDRKRYNKGASRRYKTIKHYVGCKISLDQQVFGVINIEFHNKNLFAEEEDFYRFTEEHIYPFILLLEYQFLKDEFFKNLKRIDTVESVAA